MSQLIWKSDDLNKIKPEYNNFYEFYLQQQQQLLQQSLVITKIFLNEHEVFTEDLSEMTIPFSDISSVHFVCKEKAELLSQSLLEVQEVLTAIIEQCQHISQSIRTGDIENSLQKFIQVVDTQKWLIENFVFLLSDNNETVNLEITQGWRKLEQRILQALGASIEAFNQNNYLELADLIDAEWVCFLTQWNSFIDEI